ncbi:PaaI family thioesterase [Brevibacillus daliensis]|uniref:PaaI family thioesterase n=1 Tax=Brevibacillus daliensis TaxID=2892995 RepID=UPI001E42C5AA|nr:PaaI family thioesterase [Brevibacillus daliensis]
MLNQKTNRFNEHVGIEVLHRDDEGCRIALTVRPEHFNSLDNVVHGGVTATLADVVMGHGAAPYLNGVQQCVTVETKINYVAPAKGERLEAVSKVIKSGRKLIIMEARVTCDGELVAFASGTYARINTEKS